MSARLVARLAAVLVATAGSAGAGVAQDRGTVRGLVLNAITGDPLAGVSVSILGTELSVMTDEQGRYLIRQVKPGLIQLAAQKVGFHPITTAYYVLTPDSTVVVDFKLAPLAFELSPLEVRGGRVEDRAAIGAKVLTPKDLPGRGNILNALQGVVAGLQTAGRRENSRVSIRRSRSDVLYVVDGVVVTPPLTFYIDVQDVECVEVRRGYRAAQEFRPSANSETYGGVILIWTRGSQAPKPRECASR